MKNFILQLVVICIIILGVLFNCFVSVSREPYDTALVYKDNEIDSNVLSEFEDCDIRAIEKEINELTKIKRAEEAALKKEEERVESYESLQKHLQSGKITLRQLFSDTYFAGDSLMHGLNSYGVLDSANMSTMVNASLYHLQDNISKIISNNPGNLVLHYGINMLVNTDSARQSFIDLYESLLVHLKKELPDTKIFVSSIFNVSSKVQRQYPGIEDYNFALSKMCKSIGVTFIDNNPILPGDETYYGGDGIHLSKEFYSAVWLPHLYFEMNLSDNN